MQMFPKVAIPLSVTLWNLKSTICDLKNSLQKVG